MNLADAERIEGQLQALGMQKIISNQTTASSSSQEVDPDIVVLNTCSIRDHAEQKVYSVQLLGSARQAQT